MSRQDIEIYDYFKSRAEKDGDIFFDDVEATLRKQAPYFTVNPESLGHLTANDFECARLIIKSETDNFAKYASMYYGAVVDGYIAGGHHERVSQLFAHFIKSNYVLEESRAELPGTSLFNALKSFAVREYIKAGMFNSADIAADMLSRHPSKLMRTVIANEFLLVAEEQAEAIGYVADEVLALAQHKLDVRPRIKFCGHKDDYVKFFSAANARDCSVHEKANEARSERLFPL